MPLVTTASICVEFLFGNYSRWRRWWWAGHPGKMCDSLFTRWKVLNVFVPTWSFGKRIFLIDIQIKQENTNFVPFCNVKQISSEYILSTERRLRPFGCSSMCRHRHSSRLGGPRIMWRQRTFVSILCPEPYMCLVWFYLQKAENIMYIYIYIYLVNVCGKNILYVYRFKVKNIFFSMSKAYLYFKKTNLNSSIAVETHCEYLQPKAWFLCGTHT